MRNRSKLIFLTLLVFGLLLGPVTTPAAANSYPGLVEKEWYHGNDILNARIAIEVNGSGQGRFRFHLQVLLHQRQRPTDQPGLLLRVRHGVLVRPDHRRLLRKEPGRRLRGRPDLDRPVSDAGQQSHLRGGCGQFPGMVLAQRISGRVAQHLHEKGDLAHRWEPHHRRLPVLVVLTV